MSIINNNSNIANSNITNNSDVKNLKAIKQVSKEFEAVFLKQILENGLKNVKLTEDSGSNIIKGMYIDALSQNGGGLGIEKMLTEHILKQQKGLL